MLLKARAVHWVGNLLATGFEKQILRSPLVLTTARDSDLAFMISIRVLKQRRQVFCCFSSRQLVRGMGNGLSAEMSFLDEARSSPIIAKIYRRLEIAFLEGESVWYITNSTTTRGELGPSYRETRKQSTARCQLGDLFYFAQKESKD